MINVIDICKYNLHNDKEIAEEKAEDELEATYIQKKFEHNINQIILTGWCPIKHEKPCTNCQFPLIRI